MLRSIKSVQLIGLKKDAHYVDVCTFMIRPSDSKKN